MAETTLEWNWTDARELTVAGRPFADTERFYSRLPARAKNAVPAKIWELAQQPTGLRVEFETDSTRVGVELTQEADPDAPKPGRDHSVDLYVKEAGRWQWAGVTTEGVAYPVTRSPIFLGAKRGRRQYIMYLPHGSMVNEVKVGVEPEAILKPTPLRPEKPICFYGTSIMHGFCASRAGMTYPAILQRRLDYPIWNLGFSGNARMDEAVTPFLAEIDPAVYVVACLENLWPEEITRRTEPFVRSLRSAHPETPILLMENIVYQRTYVLEDRRGGWGAKNDALRMAYRRLQEAEVANVHYLEGDHLLGEDGEATVDGTHPTDLGFFRIANALEKPLAKLVGRKLPA